MKNVAIEYAGVDYPSESYNPSELYPEYIWGEKEINTLPNKVYEAIRKCFCDLGLDSDNFGGESWNPLGEIIHQGDIVLLKPNLVVSDHPNLECIVTNPSVVRAVLDFVCIALKGTGQIIIGDAPMQRCDFSELIAKTGYDKIINFYKSKGIQISLVDFRGFVSSYASDDVKILKKFDQQANDFVSVDLQRESLHCSHDRFYKRYRVTNYDYRKMRKYHNPLHHIYLIRKEVLAANVIINLPKPKTHRKAGFTGSLKNMVGTVVHKECLPHHIRGARTSGGDEYLKRDFFKCWRTFCYEKIDLSNIYQKKKLLPLYKKMLKMSDSLVGKYRRDDYSEGSWYGNDTIWRTFWDINRCILYADKEGVLHDEKQRKTITIADMVISGEGEGPVHASPKKIGVIIAGENPVAVDSTIVQLMGFDMDKIPAFNGIKTQMKYSMGIENEEEIRVVSSLFNFTKLDEIPLKWNFTPTRGWKNHIERKN